MRGRIACGTTMHDATAIRRALCPRCQRPLRGCLCRWVAPTSNRVPLVVLQHPLEQGHAKGSLPLLRLSLSACAVDVGEVFSAGQLSRWLRPGTWLLYPGDSAAADAVPPAGTVQQLLLLDGTWRKTRKLLHLNPVLRQLPRYTLPAPPPSRYAIRKAQDADQRSTLEAACLALGALENRPSHYAPLLQAFSDWVRAQAALNPIKPS